MKVNKKILKKIISKLWPLNRSITGNDVRKTHKILSKITNFKRIEIKSNTKVFDWKVPDEWIIKDAYVINPEGKKILSLKDNNLHLLNYSKPFKGFLKLEDLKKKLYSNPLKPNVIPYVTSYYEKKWGFCIKHKDLKKLKKGKYYVYINSKFKKNGSLTLSDKIYKGKSKKEIIFQSYTCHPSMLVNEILGPIITVFLARYVEKIKKRNYTYRFVLGPETIGTISYLNQNFKEIKKNFMAGYVLTCLGIGKNFFFKSSKSKDSVTNKLYNGHFSNKKKFLIDYGPGGSDERQYNMKGINLPMGCIMSVIPTKYKEYHSSADNLNLLNYNNVILTIKKLQKFIDYIEKQEFPEFKNNKCEPFLSKYVNFYGTKNNLNIIPKNETLALKWLVHFCDGNHSIDDIQKKSKINKKLLNKILQILKKKGLII